MLQLSNLPCSTQHTRRQARQMLHMQLLQLRKPTRQLQHHLL
jgi:hypothetical protein